MFAELVCKYLDNNAVFCNNNKHVFMLGNEVMMLILTLILPQHITSMLS